ncbi:1-acyl-sn-glycerol-3-phosphate acyltransferase [Xanthomonadaceae bacterium JHOS43]|nr:1-acyl-sn-glycerol-3-phosphate acyltransferase [Xanthomonadaceae bacterium JHOS43]MCX7564241.1 1-acyl-sn-glycerol-3-phosphate acyltransferase [Xanthomonadaceae bacterium XH05]
MRRVVEELPPSAPRQGNVLTRAFGRAILRTFGWRIDGTFPDVRHMVIIIAPHSSAWDAVWGIAGMLALGVRITFMAKAELFRGPLGWLLRGIGGVPVDRSRAHGAVDQATALLKGDRPVWFLLAPEGTRRRVEHWKSGFWHIARNAGVPVLYAHFHYPTKVMGLGPVATMSDNPEADMAAIREHYRPFIGKRRGTV